MNRGEFRQFLREFQFERCEETLTRINNYQVIAGCKTGLVVTKCFPMTLIEENSHSAQYLSVCINEDTIPVMSLLRNGMLVDHANQWESKYIVLYDPASEYPAQSVSYKEAVKFVLEYLSDLSVLHEVARQTFDALRAEAERVFSLGYMSWGLDAPPIPSEYGEERKATALDCLRVFGIDYPTGLYFGHADMELEPGIWILSSCGVSRETKRPTVNGRECIWTIGFPESFIDEWERKFVVVADEGNPSMGDQAVSIISFVYEYLSAFKSLMSSLIASTAAMLARIRHLLPEEYQLKL